MPYALQTIYAPNSYAAGYQAGDPIPEPVIENWSLVEGEHYAADQPTPEQVAAPVVPRPANDTDRGAWVAYAVSRGTDPAEAEGMDRLGALRQRPPAGDRRRPGVGGRREHHQGRPSGVAAHRRRPGGGGRDRGEPGLTVASDVRFVVEPKFEVGLLGIAGPALDAAAVVVAAGQRRRIPVSEDGSHGRQAGYARDRVHVEVGLDVLGPYRDIGSDALTPEGYNYPIGLELGTRAHTITSHGKYPLRNAKTGQIFGRTVNHPGNPPMPWCRAALGDLAGWTFR